MKKIVQYTHSLTFLTQNSWASLARGVSVGTVVSSAFDGQVGLAHHTLLAAALSPASDSVTAHGLATWNAFSPASPSAHFGARVSGSSNNNNSGGGVSSGGDELDPLLCEALLIDHMDSLLRVES
jgi:hypothetical protein